ncbi:hypothetical protein [Bacillus subtilis]|uniref:hypothetical protein n=1 Tax=Bacillus subtilis TaxID=1423 RepID=UPI003982B173
MKAGASKGNGVRKLSQLLGVEQEEVMYIATTETTTMMGGLRRCRGKRYSGSKGDYQKNTAWRYDSGACAEKIGTP